MPAQDTPPATPTTTATPPREVPVIDLQMLTPPRTIHVTLGFLAQVERRTGRSVQDLLTEYQGWFAPADEGGVRLASGRLLLGPMVELVSAAIGVPEPDLDAHVPPRALAPAAVAIVQALVEAVYRLAGEPLPTRGPGGGAGDEDAQAGPPVASSGLPPGSGSNSDSPAASSTPSDPGTPGR
ncbi:MAG: hypothetical protein ACK4WH_00960 [Phycisphaerales bacterium]